MKKAGEQDGEPSSRPGDSDVASRLALLQADIEHLKEQVESDRKEREDINARIAAVIDQVTEVRSLISGLERQNAEIRVSAERSSAFIKAVQPEKLAVELVTLSSAVSELRAALSRHESQGKELV